MKTISTSIRALMIGAVLATASYTPAAMAQTVSVMVLNTRSDDGVYRPALRVIRSGTVTFLTEGGEGSNGLTNATLKNRAALNEWIAANLSADASGSPVNVIIEEPAVSSSGNCDWPEDDFSNMTGFLAMLDRCIETDGYGDEVWNNRRPSRS